MQFKPLFTSSWNQNVINDPAYGGFVFIHITITEPHLLWKITSKYPWYIKKSPFSYVYVWWPILMEYGLCELCKCSCVDFVDHFFSVTVLKSVHEEKSSGIWFQTNMKLPLKSNYTICLIITLLTSYLEVQIISFLILLLSTGTSFKSVLAYDI